MKTAEEWANEFRDGSYILEDMIQEAQLDAFRAGMREAASIYTVEMRKYMPTHIGNTELDITKCILTAADNLKEIPTP